MSDNFNADLVMVVHKTYKFISCSGDKCLKKECKIFGCSTTFAN